MREQRTCGLCGESYPAEELYCFDGLELCPHCLDERTLTCERCGARIWSEDNAGSSDTPLCQSCYDDHYTHCCQCGTLLHESNAYYAEDDEYDEYPYCVDCYQERYKDNPIHDYYYKPEPIFYGEGPRFFGVELEIDGGGEIKGNARSLLEVANRDAEYFYIKHDGSLDDGMELVTYPLSLEYHLRKVPWEALCGQARALGYLSHRANTCGLHVHVSRKAFGTTERAQDEAIARVLYFFEKHWEELLKFSRRTPRQLERWAARYVAVQLIEQQRALTPASLSTMAEAVEGSFVFTVLDDRDNLYFVKGDNPLCLLLFPYLGLYVYASTEAILRTALDRLWLKRKPYEPVSMDEGEILVLTPDGEAHRDHFTLARDCFSPWYFGRRGAHVGSACLHRSAEQQYVQELKSVAAAFGYGGEEIDAMLADGWTTDEIEEMLYDCGGEELTCLY